MTEKNEAFQQRLGSPPPVQECNRDDLSSDQRHMPIEADNELRRRIEADPSADPEHLGKLDHLVLLRTSSEEKERVYLSSLDRVSSEILDDLLEVAIDEIREEHATVVGIVNVMIARMLDITVALRQRELWRLLVPRWSPEYVRLEMVRASKALGRPQE